MEFPIINLVFGEVGKPLYKNQLEFGKNFYGELIMLPS